MRPASGVLWIAAALTASLVAAARTSTAQDGCVADLTGDGVVNGTDLAIVLGGWGPCPVETTFVGGVVRAGGVPVPGATVTTDLGGKTTSGEGGIFLLQVELPSVIETVVLSATAEVGGVGFEGTKTVSPVNVGGANLVGLIEVSSGGCDSGFAWLPTFAGGLGVGPGYARAFATFDDGSGAALYACGEVMHEAGGVIVGNVARWDGAQWSALGAGVTGAAFSMAVFDGGAGPELYVGGGFASAGGDSSSPSIARWNGTTWLPVGQGVVGAVYAMCVHDDGSGPALYVGGQFSDAGGSGARNLARWNGSRWSQVGGGALGLGASVRDLLVVESVDGPLLVAAGNFAEVGGIPTNNIAAWNGKSWIALGPGLGATAEEFVLALAVYDDGSGPALHAGGSFVQTGGENVIRLAKWQDGAWSQVGGGVSGGTVVDLLTWNDGTGSSLYVAGAFTTAGASGARYVARWDGTSWSSLGGGPDGLVDELHVHDGSLFLGGNFDFAGGLSARGIAQWGCTK